MKIESIVVAFFLLLVFKITAAQNSDGIKPCNLKELCESSIGKYTAQQKVVIKKHWDDFFGSDLEYDFPATYKKNKLLNVVSVKVDGLGCFYPSFISDTLLKEGFLDNKISDKSYDKSTFFHLLKSRKYVERLKSLANSMEVKDSIESISQLTNNTSNPDFFGFRRRWNALFLKDQVNRLNSVTGNGKVEKVFLFISGFNVPYSLSHIQGNIIFEDIANVTDSDEIVSNTLFVRLFWPSFNYKNSNFDSENCDYSNIEKLNTAVISANYVNKRAYLAGLALREILSEVDFKCKIQVVTHSLGSTVITSALMDPHSKTSNQNARLIRIKLDEFERIVVNTKNPVHAFMNAPSIPGKSTFAALDTERNKNHFFTVGYNENDETLLKQKIRFWPFRKIRLPAVLSSTTLGCNRRRFFGMGKPEIKRTIKRIPTTLRSNFQPVITGYQTEHDFFCYRQQIQYQEQFKKFVLGKQ